MGLIKKFYTKKTVSRYGFVSQVYQPIFILFLILIVFLAKESPGLVFPQILYLMFGFLFCNTLINYALGRDKISYWLIDLMAVFNCILVTGIVYYSGTSSSYLWVLYLFPIFSATMVLDKKQSIGVIFLAFLLWFLVYKNPNKWDIITALEWGGKSALILIGTVFIHNFIGEKKHIEEKLKTQRVKLDSMQAELMHTAFETTQRSQMEVIGHKASKIIHDIATPVTIILASAKMLTKTETPAKQDIQRIIDASLMCKNIISNSLDFNSEGASETKKLNITEIVDSAIDTLMPLLISKNISVKKGYHAKEVFVNANRLQLERLFINIITNAKKAVDKNGKITAIIKISGNYADVSIEDTGPGFPSELLKSGPKMLKTSRMEGYGTGLGLIVAKELAQKNSGELIIANKPTGKGAVVTVRFTEINT